MSLPARYTRTAIALHWLIALLISMNLLLIWFVDYWPEDRVRLVIDTHKSIGITVLGLAVVRLLWRYTHRPPALPSSYARWEVNASHWAHMTLYFVIFLMPMSGWLQDSAWKDAAAHPMLLFGVIPWPRISWIASIQPAAKETLHDAFGALHTYGSYLLYALWAAHMAGALKHQFVDKENELQRMLP